MVSDNIQNNMIRLVKCLQFAISMSYHQSWTPFLQLFSWGPKWQCPWYTFLDLTSTKCMLLFCKLVNRFSWYYRIIFESNQFPRLIPVPLTTYCSVSYPEHVLMFPLYVSLTADTQQAVQSRATSNGSSIITTELFITARQQSCGEVMFSVVSVCPQSKWWWFPCDHYPWCIGPHFTWPLSQSKHVRT